MLSSAIQTGKGFKTSNNLFIPENTLLVCNVEVFVFKFVAINGLTASSIATRKVTALRKQSPE